MFAALTAILAKIGIKDVPSNVATAIRTIIIMGTAWGLIFFTREYKQIAGVNKVSLFFIVLSGIATSLSWLFYFKALQLGDASKVAPVDKLSLVMTILLAVLLLKEKVTVYTIIGAALITVGTILTSLTK